MVKRNCLLRSIVWIPAAVMVLLHCAAAQDLLQDRGYKKLPGYRSSERDPKPGDRIDLSLVVGTPLEESINPDEYVVGANDVFAIALEGVSNVSIPLIVTPDGTLLIPNVGGIAVAGKTLRETKDLVISEVKKYYKVAQMSFALISPRQFIVTVIGGVRNPGPYVVPSTFRVDKVIALANLPTELQQPPGQEWVGDFSRRNVIVHRQGKPDRLVDIDLFYASGRKDVNPRLMEGDVIIVPPRNFDQGSVSVYGAVNQPAQYEYREHDSLWSLIRIANGLSKNADPASVEVTRFSLDGNSSKSEVVDISRIIDGREPDRPVQNRDRIVVREKIDRRRDYKVHVRGEVKFPGMYPISPDSTRLTEIIRRAGGFTEYAYLPAAEIERKQLTIDGLNLNLAREAMINLRMSDEIITPEERSYYDLEAQLRRGTVAVDFDRLFAQNDLSGDVLLRDGDIIYIPNSSKTVYVYGQVPKPGYVAHKEGGDLRYYIQLAGGYGEEAESGKTRVIKGKTREWRDPSDTVIEPGDYIWVPKEVKYPVSYYMNLISQAASFVSVVLSMTVILIQITSK